MKDYIPAVIKVIPQDNFHVHVPLMMGKLKDCTIMNDTVVWDITGNRDNRDCIDIDPFTLYEMECISEKE